MTHRNRKRELEIRIGIGDWEEELGETEASVATDEDLIERVVDGMHPMQIGRLAVTAAELTDQRPAAVGANKLLLQQGAATAVAQLVARQRMEMSRKSDGRVFNLRRFCGTVTDRNGKEAEGDGDAYHRFIEIDNIAALARAEKYLEVYVPGHIVPRLKTIAAHDGDVRGAAQKLHDTIDAMIEQLEKPQNM